MNIPGSEGKLDCGWIAFILFARDSESEINGTQIMRRWFIRRYTHREVKIHFARVLREITSVGSNAGCVLFQEISRLLKRPGK